VSRVVLGPPRPFLLPRRVVLSSIVPPSSPFPRWSPPRSQRSDPPPAPERRFPFFLFRNKVPSFGHLQANLSVLLLNRPPPSPLQFRAAYFLFSEHGTGSAPSTSVETNITLAGGGGPPCCQRGRRSPPFFFACIGRQLVGVGNDGRILLPSLRCLICRS